MSNENNIKTSKKKKSRKNLDCLKTTCDFYLEKRNLRHCSRAIREVNIDFNKILREMYKHLHEKNFIITDCYKHSKAIDDVLYSSAKLTHRATAKQSLCLDILKDKVWFVLETLENYCKAHHNKSIW